MIQYTRGRARSAVVARRDREETHLAVTRRKGKQPVLLNAHRANEKAALSRHWRAPLPLSPGANVLQSRQMSLDSFEASRTSR
jgi:hypothetical protein